MQRLPATSQGITAVQSALHPAGPDSLAVAQLSWIMILGGGLIFFLVMLLLAYALFVPQRYRGWLAHRATILYGGIAFPIAVLTALLIYGLFTTRTLIAIPADGALNIHVTGEQFWWRVRYEADRERPAFDTANEIHIPVGRPVRLALATADVIHSFWIPALGGKLDMMPGQVNTLMLRADRPGTYRGQCTEFCGGAHALMSFDVVVHESAEFDAWRERQQADAIKPDAQFLQEGERLFHASGCGACHTVRGSEASGQIGPDLTHVGSRATIAAAAFPNNRGTLAGWIADSQHLKPSNGMPPFNIFSGQQLRVLAAYLEGLK